MSTVKGLFMKALVDRSSCADMPTETPHAGVLYSRPADICQHDDGTDLLGVSS